MSGSTASNTFLSSTELDFNAQLTNFRNFLKNQDIFKDYNFDAPNISMLLSVMAFNTMNNGFYLNMQGTEAFLDSCQIRDSGTSHAKEKNYLPRSAKSSKAYVNITINVTDTNVSTVLIPKGFLFSGIYNNFNYNYQTTEDILVTTSANGFVASNVEIVEGYNVTDIFNVYEQNIYQTFTLSNPLIDTDSLSVVVQNSITDTTNSQYYYTSSLFGLTANSKIFYLEPTFNNSYQLLFGDGVFGIPLSNGNIINANYLVTVADQANGINLFNPLNTIGNGYNVTCQTVLPASGGSSPETLDSIRYNATRWSGTQNRAVTYDDYKILLLKEFGNIKAINVFGGNEISDAPQYGTIIISVVTNSGNVLSNLDKQNIINYITPKINPILTPKIIDPEYLYVRFTSIVNYNKNITTNSPQTIKSIISTAANNFSNTFLNTFSNTFRYSKFCSALDASDASIISNETAIYLFKNYPLQINSLQSLSIDFGNEIQDHNKNDPSYPTIYTSQFTYNGITACFIQDDGNGILNIYQSTSNGNVIVYSSIGTFDYVTGTGSINNLNSSYYANNELTINAVPMVNDIFPIRNNVIMIDTNSSSIVMNAL
jgi:hypothetical protein